MSGEDRRLRCTHAHINLITRVQSEKKMDVHQTLSPHKRLGKGSGSARLPPSPPLRFTGYLIDFRMIKLYLLPICWQSMEEVLQ